MGEVVNLRRARKRAEREAEARRAERNRTAHGRTKAERRASEADVDRARTHLVELGGAVRMRAVEEDRGIDLGNDHERIPRFLHLRRPAL